MSDIIGRDAFEQALNSPKLVIVDFRAPRCGPCRMLWPVLESIASQMPDQVSLVKVNVDEVDNETLSISYGISSIPHVYIFKWGEQVDDFIGALPQSTISEIIKNICNLLYNLHDDIQRCVKITNQRKIRQTPPKSQSDQSQHIVSLLLPLIKQYNTWAVYIPLDWEPNLSDWYEILWNQHITTVIPYRDLDGKYCWYYYTKDDCLYKRIDIFTLYTDNNITTK